MQLFAEIRRRGLLKVAIGYLGVSWLALEIGHTLFLIFDLPHAGLQLVFALLAVGFPVALLGAWQGWFSREDPAPGHGTPHEGPWLAAVFGVVAVFAIAVAIGVRFFGMGHGEHGAPSTAESGAPAQARAPTLAFTPPPHSVAVLPFVNMSGDPHQDYFSDGLSEELLNSLTRVNDLQVAARTSSFYFKGKDAKLSDIGRELNVGAILEGSVRKDGQHVRITAQLINTMTGFHLWSQTYDRELKNILALQTDIATAVTQAMQATLTAGSSAEVELGGTRNPQAFDAYLRGRSIARLAPDEPNSARRVEAFKEAVDRDPAFAKSQAEYAIALCAYAANFSNDLNGHGRYQAARVAAEKAVAIAPQLGEAHAALAVVHYYRLELTAARAELERALEASPHNADVLVQAGWYLTSLGAPDRGLAALHKGVALDPINPNAYRQLGFALQSARRYPEAIEALDRAARLNPDDGRALGSKGVVYLRMGRVDDAIHACDIKKTEWVLRLCRSLAFDRAGRKAEARQEFDAMRRELGDGAVYQYAEIHAQWGEPAKALDNLERARKVMDPGLTQIVEDTFLDPLRSEPRFQAVLHSLDFPAGTY